MHYVVFCHWLLFVTGLCTGLYRSLEREPREELWRCISCLLKCDKSSQNLVDENSNHLLSLTVSLSQDAGSSQEILALEKGGSLLWHCSQMLVGAAVIWRFGTRGSTSKVAHSCGWQVGACPCGSVGVLTTWQLTSLRASNTRDQGRNHLWPIWELRTVTVLQSVGHRVSCGSLWRGPTQGSEYQEWNPGME